jgi:hypothetical protein
MKWTKLGRVFCPDGQFEWMRSHAANPVAEHRAGDVFRIHFSTRDAQNRSRIGYVEIDLREPQRILSLSQAPVLEPGALGLFDDSGVSLACLTNVRGQRYLYYLGWNLGVTVPWRNAIGLAISPGFDAPFTKVSLAPVLDRGHEDPYSLSYPYVLQDGALFRMIYGSNLSWGAKQEDMAHLLKYAESDDGIHWRRDGQVAIGFKDPAEYALSRPCIQKDASGYKAWFSYRGPAYRIGYAESDDCKRWTRRDELAGIDVSPSGWDSESIEYPHLFQHAGKTYMVYNGNRYGLTGFGLAVAE